MWLNEEYGFWWVDSAGEYDLGKLLGLLSQVALVAHVAMVVMEPSSDCMVIHNWQQQCLALLL